MAAIFTKSGFESSGEGFRFPLMTAASDLCEVDSVGKETETHGKSGRFKFRSCYRMFGFVSNNHSCYLFTGGYRIMFGKRFFTLSAVYWTFLFAALTAVTAYTQAQNVTTNQSQIALLPSEMASIFGGETCRECKEWGSYRCEGNISCLVGDCPGGFGDCLAQGANPQHEEVNCYYKERRCDGDVIEDGSGRKQCVSSSAGVGRRTFICICSDADECTSFSDWIPANWCNYNTDLTC